MSHVLLATPRSRRAARAPGLRWTGHAGTCDPWDMSPADPLLVVRRHVDFLRVRSAICSYAR